jgi:hypothetical protein
MLHCYMPSGKYRRMGRRLTSTIIECRLCSVRGSVDDGTFIRISDGRICAKHLRKGLKIHNKTDDTILKCKYCGDSGSVSDGTFHRYKNGIKRYCIICIHTLGTTDRLKKRDMYAKLRLIAIKILGGQCSCCGERIYEFLEIDHIGGWKTHGLSNKGHPTAYTTVRRMWREGWPKDKYRVLCTNCNRCLGVYGYCPHQSRIPDPTLRTPRNRWHKLSSDPIYQGSKRNY